MNPLENFFKMGNIEKIEQLLDKIPTPIFMLNKEHKIIAWNRTCEALTGIAKEDIHGKNWQSLGFYDPPRPILADFLLDGAEAEKIRSFYGEKCHVAASNNGSWEGEDFFPNLNGGIWLYFTASLIKDDKGSVLGAVETLMDITSIKEKEFKLEKYNHRLIILHEVIRELSGETTLQGLLDKAVSLIGEKLNYPNISILAQEDPNKSEVSLSIKAASCLNKEQFSKLSDKLKKSGKGLSYKAAREMRIINTPSTSESEDFFPFLDNISSELDIPIIFSGTLLGVISVEGTVPFDEDDEKIFQIFADQLGVLWKVTESMEIIKRQASIDQLTGLPNRFLLFSRLKEEQHRLLRYGGQLSLAMMDLAGFKAINDNLGHFVGDKVLREVGKVLRSTLRQSDFCARFGGDEFVIFFPNVPHEEVLTAISRLRNALSSIHIEELPEKYHIEADFGLAFYPDDGKKLTQLLQLADQRMYDEKRRMQRLRE
ncbi:diguanylate cyclase [Thermovirga sp.]|uniref:sensor domain-containing diguanylate cyclase n=1 Tax=Thermovirga sp. TaxID=2699834 RepID=UPI0025FEA7B8|nr:diguanylate cyclase [Thermovirga sp.]MBO8154330.1 diguanylate cyclase [Thermovirga sp.]